jgi:hypothetical protein
MGWRLQEGGVHRTLTSWVVVRPARPLLTPCVPRGPMAPLRLLRQSWHCPTSGRRSRSNSCLAVKAWTKNSAEPAPVGTHRFVACSDRRDVCVGKAYTRQCARLESSQQPITSKGTFGLRTMAVQNFSSILARSSKISGLARKEAAPACFAKSMSCFSLDVVRIRTGISITFGSDFTIARALRPSSLGMFKSRSIK